MAGVDLVTNACFSNMFDSAGNYTYSTCGTSFAAPVVAGAAALLQDYFIGTWGFGAPTSRLFAYLIGMGDRDRAPLAKLLVGTDKDWGGGRFQMRSLFAAEPGEVFGWEGVAYTITTGSVISHKVKGAGNEPAGLKVAKTVMRVNEPSPTTMSNHKLEWFDKDCGTGSAAWAIDNNANNTEHRRVTLGTSAANKALCAKVTVTKTASNANRTAELFTYYSTLDSMR